MKSALKVLLAAITTLALSLSLATAALAHGGVPDGHGAPDGPLGVLLMPPEFVLGASPSSASSTPSSGAGDERVGRGCKGACGHGGATGFGKPLRGRVRFES